MKNPIDEVYQAALAAGSGGIRWNASNNYIQLRSTEGTDNWINWQYHNPNAEIDLIPVTSSYSGTRTDGVTYSMSANNNPYTNNQSEAIPIAFCGNSSRYAQYTVTEGSTGTHAIFTFTFSMPQILTTFKFTNYFSGTVKSSNFIISGANNNSDFELIGNYNSPSGVSTICTAIIAEPKLYYRYQIQFNTASFPSNNTIILRDAHLLGYSYQGE